MLKGIFLLLIRITDLQYLKEMHLKQYNEKEILPDPNVNAIYQDKTGAIWFGTNAGISRYYPGSGKKPVIYNEANNSIYEDIRFFREDRDGNLWIGANEGGVIML